MVLTTPFVLGVVGLGVMITGALIFLDDHSVQLFKNLIAGRSELASFQRTYLLVYLTCMMADWLQGPFVYALYESYGFSRGDNASLFVAGFGSSFVFGTFIGALADKYGRKSFAQLFCVVYIAHNVTKHWNDYNMLLGGRIMGGVSTSLLFSVFDAWLVSEHNARGFDPDDLGGTFAIAIFGNSIAAILAGEIGQVAADMMPLSHVGGQPAPVPGGMHMGGYIAPFDVSMVLLCVGMGLIAMTWTENYGQNSGSGSGFGQAFKVLHEQPQVLMCGIVCSLFEASMFLFVFNWTPCVMEEGQPKPPFGHIFAGFMVFCMLGSRIFAFLSQSYRIETIGVGTLAVAGVCHVVPVIFESVYLRFFAFLIFEGCVGLYFPMMGSLKGQIVPEDLRSTIYNLYRIPLNAIVVATLVFKADSGISFTLTTLLLGIACMTQVRLGALRAKSSYKAVTSPKTGNDDPSAIEMGKTIEA
eukprot:TRINITY_DN10361_c0_g1_i1.p1 TRINITY_DN10361_c0_g1~~TRINITY_DN10361_c0_g1_i1.p1  ORF type:complete len:470 (-),score=114.48 TRINITY_DN10361_c0_g1_i1:287-1696(-)